MTTGLRLKYTGLRIVYVPFWHMPLARSRTQTGWKRRQARERVQRYRRRLTAQRRDERRQDDSGRRQPKRFTSLPEDPDPRERNKWRTALRRNREVQSRGAEAELSRQRFVISTTFHMLGVRQ